MMVLYVWFLFLLWLSPHLVHAETQSAPGVMLTPAQVVAAGPFTLSPPALRYDASGTLHVAWQEKPDQQGSVKVRQIAGASRQLGSAVQVNPATLGPEALHQAPGLTAQGDGTVALSWSTPNRAPGAMFASDLRVAASGDGGRTFTVPVQVNDDGLPISHTFEDLLRGPEHDLYVMWLDGRGKDRSGAAVQFACSRDGGATFGPNITVDGMACPCCRPMLAAAPDGSLWAAWRKTYDGNVRDIVVAQSVDRGKTFGPPHLVREDHWVFSACPHRGPSVGFDRQGRLYVGWYTEGTDEQARIYLATSDDRAGTFTEPVSLHTSTNSLPDNLRLAVHPDGIVAAVWEEVTGVRKRVVLRLSLDRGQTFGPVIPLSAGAKAEHPTVAIDPSGRVALAWTEHAFPTNKIVVQEGRVDLPKP
ncbi:MAG: sialidase family protein [Nitrospira sp.]|nr:exo-alpha-sialidase [Nitrospira sp.]MDR4475255.1 glycoside hydrolase [Nitrospira sp.]